ncbi:hypothetical protein [Streptomyces sp. NPDC001966]
MVASENLAGGPEGDTLRWIGERLDVLRGPIGHFSPWWTNRWERAFGKVAGAEPGTLIPPGRAEGVAVEHLAHSFALATGSGCDVPGRRHRALGWKRPARRTAALVATH